MSTLTIYKDNNDGFTILSNKFIDEYLKDANDAQIKVYLYLLRMVGEGLPTSISDIADKFNHTEKDVIRALKYWEKARLLSLEFDENKELTGIHFTVPGQESRLMAPIIPLKPVPAETETATVPLDGTPASVKSAFEKANETPDYSAKPSYSRDQLKQFKEAPETNQILFVAETYLQQPLTVADMEALFFIHHELGFTCELIDYLLQYCIERGKKKFSYIRKVAISMAEAGVTTPKQAKSYLANTYDKEVYTVLKALGRSSMPTPKEAELIMKWYKTYAFSMDIIEVACGRTVLATDSHRLEYCDKILSSWQKAGVKTIADIAACDAAFKQPKASTPKSTPSKSSFNQFDQRTSYDFDALEKMLGN